MQGIKTGDHIDVPRCLEEQRIIVVDVETTGFKQDDRVIEVGLLWIEDEKVVMGLSRMCNPGMGLPDVITKLTGITQKEVDAAKPFSLITDFLIDTMPSPSVVMAYNHSFDFKFLSKEVGWSGKNLKISNLVIDPLIWVRNEDRGKSCKLGDACRRRGVKVEGEHRALSDCLTTVRLLNTVKMPKTLTEALGFQRSLGDGLGRKKKY